VLALPPLKLVSQDSEESFLHAQQLHGVAGAMANQMVALPHRHANLPIDAEEGLFATALNLHIDACFVGNDQRAMGERMRAHRCNDEGGNRRHEHRASGRERIRRRTGRRRDDDAVSLAIEYEGAVNNEVKIQEAGDGALAHHRIVQGKVMREAFSFAYQAAVEHSPLLAGTVAAVNRLKGGIHFAEGNFRQESQRAKVDREDGNTLVPQGSGRREQCSIASQNQREVGMLLSDRRPRYDLAVVGVLRRLLVEIKMVSTVVKPRKQFGKNAGQLRLRRLRDDRHRLHVFADCVSVTVGLSKAGVQQELLVSCHPENGRLDGLHIRTSEIFYSFNNS